MKYLLLATIFVIAGFTVVFAQEDNQEQTTVVLAGQQRAAQMEVDQARVAYSARRFSVARRHADKAYELDPTNKDSLIIIAQSIHELFHPDDSSAANVVRAREAIAAYQRVSTYPADDEVYNAVYSLYAAIDETELLYSWVMQRAANSGLSPANRAEAYSNLASLDLAMVSRINEKVAHALYVEETDTVDSARLDDSTRYELGQGMEIAARGIEMARQAIALDETIDSAWTHEILLLQNISRLFELGGDDLQAQVYTARSYEVSKQASDLRIKREAALTAKLITVDCDTICDKAIKTPKPRFPAIARACRAVGSVVVDIEINEQGNVISASAIGGHPLLRAAAVEAARASTFSPTRPSGQSVTTFGTLIYTFNLE